MIKYHGTPITPKKVFYDMMPSRNGLVSFVNTQDINKILEVCDKIMLDNGAFTIWNKTKTPKRDWMDYYEWVRMYYPRITNFIIPDIIEGTEEDNNNLLLEVPSDLIDKGIPVWHFNESLGRLQNMIRKYNYIAFGSSSDISHCGTKPQRIKWEEKMKEVMEICCYSDGTPKIKIHMLRCLDKRVFTRFPFYSGDSTNVAQNHYLYDTIKRNKKQNIKGSGDGWKVITKRIEDYDSPKKYERLENEDKKKI